VKTNRYARWEMKRLSAVQSGYSTTIGGELSGRPARCVMGVRNNQAKTINH